MNMHQPHTLEAKAQQVIKLRDDSIPSSLHVDSSSIPSNSTQFYASSGHLAPREVEIIRNYDASSLANAIREQRYTAKEVVTAYLKSAALAQGATNCLAYMDYQGALDRAEWLDQQLGATGKVVGPLHGVPVSLKDFISLKGVPQSSGHILSAGYIPENDAQIVTALRAVGAVFYAKTTQPQGIMHLETHNFYGHTTNPFNKQLTAGGSSGGEGALLASKGSVLGVGTDIGGSIRGPCANNGLWGYKPTSKRFPRAGLIGVGKVITARIPGVIGPMGHSLRDLELFTKVVLGSKPWEEDVSLVPMPWREVDQGGKGAGHDGWSSQDGRLRVGIMREDGVVKPVAPVRRAIMGLLKALGGLESKVEVIDVDCIHADEIWDITSKLYFIDGGKNHREAFGDEPLLPLTEWILGFAQDLSRDEVTALVNRRNTLRQEWLNHLRNHQIDVLVSPVSAAPALHLGTSKYWSYTSLFNFLDWPGIAFPTGVSVLPEDVDMDVSPRNQYEKQVYDAYSPEACKDAPIGLQLVAPRWEDERIFAAMKIIEEVLPLKQ